MLDFFERFSISFTFNLLNLSRNNHPKINLNLIKGTQNMTWPDMKRKLRCLIDHLHKTIYSKSIIWSHSIRSIGPSLIHNQKKSNNCILNKVPLSLSNHLDPSHTGTNHLEHIIFGSFVCKISILNHFDHSISIVPFRWAFLNVQFQFRKLVTA